MATKQELIEGLYQYPVEVLEKLSIIAGSVLNPNLNQLVAPDFASMIDLVFKQGGLADTYFPQWTDRTSGDMGRILVELMALFSDKDFFYINHFSAESFLTTAELYRSVVHKAKSNGYNPPNNVAATTNLNVTFAAGAGETIPRGAIEFGIVGIPDMTFTNEEYVLPLHGVQTTVSMPFVHGKAKSDSGSFNGRSIVILDKDVVYGSIELTVNGTPYTEVETFANGTPSSEFFMVYTNEFGQAEIRFSKGDYGVLPSVNTPYEISYLVGGGTLGNVLAGTLTTIQKAGSTRSIVSIVQNSDATGGTALLSLEALRQNTIGFQRTLNRIVNPSDAEICAKELSDIYNAKGIAISNYIFLYVVPTGGGTASGAQILAVQGHVNPKMLMGCYLVVSPAIYKQVTMSMDVYILPGMVNADVQTLVEEVVQEYLDSGVQGKFGEGVNRFRLSSKIISRINGVQNVDYNTLEITGSPAAPTDIVVAPYELIDYPGSTITINVTGGQ